VWIGDAAAIRASYVAAEDGQAGCDAHFAFADRQRFPAVVDAGPVMIGF